MTEAAAPRRRGAMGFILVTVALDMLAGTIVGPVVPQLLKSLTGGSMAQMSAVLGAMTILYYGMQLFAGPMQGALSDTFGRRPVVIASNFGLAADYVIMALAPNLAWLFVGRTISGACAGSVTAAYAYVADVTEPDKVAARFGLLTAALSAGGAAGPLIGGFLGEFDPRLPFWVAAGLSLLNGVYGTFVLPESLARENRAPLAWRAIHPIGAVASLWRSYPVLVRWSWALVLSSLGFVGVNSVFILYVTFRFGWTPKTLGIYSTFVMLTALAVQSGLVARTIKLLGERRTLILGTLIQIAAVIGGGFADTGWGFAVAVFVLMIGGVSGPAASAIQNRIIGPSDRGRLSGAGRSLASLTGLIAPGLFAALFAAVVGQGPHALQVGAPFFACAALMIAGFVVTLQALKHTPAPVA